MTLTSNLFTTPRFYSAWTEIISDIVSIPPEGRDPIDQMILDAFWEQVKHPGILTPEEEELWDQILKQ